LKKDAKERKESKQRKEEKEIDESLSLCNGLRQYIATI
jgi:hypothetical protein